MAPRGIPRESRYGGANNEGEVSVATRGNLGDICIGVQGRTERHFGGPDGLDSIERKRENEDGRTGCHY